MASQRAADDDLHNESYVNDGNGIELGDVRPGVYNNLEPSNCDPHIYSDITPIANTTNSDTNNEARRGGSNETATVTISEINFNRTIYKVIVGLLLFCTLLCILSGVIVYHVIDANLPDNDGQVSQHMDVVPNTNLSDVLVVMDRRLDVLDKAVQAVLAKQATSVYFAEIGGWELIFRATAGNGDNVYDAWTTGKATTGVKPSSMARGNSRHYRNTQNITEWSNVTLVKYSLFENGREVAYIIFNGIGSTNQDWFGLRRVLGSSWSAVASKSGTYNNFSIVGDVIYGRRFFVNVKYGRCLDDGGFTVVSDTGSPKTCLFDTHGLYPQFLYSIIDGPIYWDKLMYGKADYMAVFYKHA